MASNLKVILNNKEKLTMQKEIVSLYVGQAGVQTGSSLWELFCAEHHITSDGHLLEDKMAYEYLETLFQQVASGTWVPRSLFVDLEPTVVDEIRHGTFRSLFHPDRMISGYEDAANNFSRGYFTVGKLLLGNINEQCRHLFEQCEIVQGILILRSLGGGTGAGLTSAMFEKLSDYSKTPKIEIPIYPSPTLSTSMVEPYNCLLGEHFCMEDIDVGLLLDNEAMFDISTKFLSINYPTYTTINRMIAQLVSSLTASARFVNILNCDLSVLQTNMVPYPRIHFPLCNFAPMMSAERANHQELTVQDLTRLVFDRNNQMMKVDHFYGKFMSCALFYRGYICPHHVYMALSEIKRDHSIEFVDWCPTGFKVGISAVPPVVIPDSKFAKSNENVAMLTNTSAIGQAWQRLTHRFYLLYSKRSFVHWFVGDGMEECEFTEALYNISALVKDYEEAAESTNNVVNDSEAKMKPNISKEKNQVSNSKRMGSEISDTKDDEMDPSTIGNTEKSASNSALKSPLTWKNISYHNYLNPVVDDTGEAHKMIPGMEREIFSQRENSASVQSNKINYSTPKHLVPVSMDQSLIQSNISQNINLKLNPSLGSNIISSKHLNKFPKSKQMSSSILDNKSEILKHDKEIISDRLVQKKSAINLKCNTSSQNTSKHKNHLIESERLGTEISDIKDDEIDPSSIDNTEKSTSNSELKSPLAWTDVPHQDYLNPVVTEEDDEMISDLDNHLQKEKSASIQSNKINSNTPKHLCPVSTDKNLIQSNISQNSNFKLNPNLGSNIISSKHLNEFSKTRHMSYLGLDNKSERLEHDNETLSEHFVQSKYAINLKCCSSSQINILQPCNNKPELNAQPDKPDTVQMSNTNLTKKFQENGIAINEKVIQNHKTCHERSVNSTKFIFEKLSKSPCDQSSESLLNFFEVNSNLSNIDTVKDNLYQDYQLLKITSTEEPQVLPRQTINFNVPSVVPKINKHPSTVPLKSTEFNRSEESPSDSFGLHPSLHKSDTLPSNSSIYSSVTDIGDSIKSERQPSQSHTVKMQIKPKEMVENNSVDTEQSSNESRPSKIHKTNFSLQLKSKATNCEPSQTSSNRLTSNYEIIKCNKNSISDSFQDKSPIISTYPRKNKMHQVNSNLKSSKEDSEIVLSESTIDNYQIAQSIGISLSENANKSNNANSKHLQGNQNCQSKFGSLNPNVSLLPYNISLSSNILNNMISPKSRYSKSYEYLPNNKGLSNHSDNDKSNPIPVDLCSITDISISDSKRQTDNSSFGNSSKYEEKDSKENVIRRDDKLKSTSSNWTISSLSPLKSLNTEHGQHIVPDSKISSPNQIMKISRLSVQSDRPRHHNINKQSQVELHNDKIEECGYSALKNHGISKKLIKDSHKKYTLHRDPFSYNRKAYKDTQLSTLNHRRCPSLDSETNLKNNSPKKNSFGTIKHLQREAKEKIKFLPRNCADLFKPVTPCFSDESINAESEKKPLLKVANLIKLQRPPILTFGKEK